MNPPATSPSNAPTIPCVLVYASEATTLPDILVAVFRLGVAYGTYEGAWLSEDPPHIRGVDLATNAPLAFQAVTERLAKTRVALATAGSAIAVLLESTPTDGNLYADWQGSTLLPLDPIGSNLTGP